jgi:hypothetical protein
MAQIDPRMLLQSAMQSAPVTGSGLGTQPPGADTTGATPAGAGAAAPTGAEGTTPANTGGMSNLDLSQLVGSGTELSQDPNAIQQMVQILQDPGTPPDQRAAIQLRLQLAALQSLGGGAAGTAGGAGGQT